MGDRFPLGYLGYLGEERYGIVLSDGNALGILGYLREGDGYLGFVPGVYGVPEGGQFIESCNATGVVTKHSNTAQIPIPHLPPPGTPGTPE